MSPRSRSLLAAAVLGVSAAGCSTSPTGPPPAPAPPPNQHPPVVVAPEVSQVDRHSPDAVAQTAVRLMYSVDATRDRGFSDGLSRAGPLLSPDYARNAATAPIRPSAQWQDWAAHHAHTDVQVTDSPEDRPPDRAQLARRAYVVTTTPVGADQWRGPAQTTLAMVTLTRAEAGWQVAEITPR